MKNITNKHIILESDSSEKTNQEKATNVQLPTYETTLCKTIWCLRDAAPMRRQMIGRWSVQSSKLYHFCMSQNYLICRLGIDIIMS